MPPCSPLWPRKGLGGDVVSIGEYRRAVAAGIPPERIVFAGVGKTAPEMAEALKGGLCQFNVESVEEAEMLSAVATGLGMEAPIAFRVNPDVEAGTHAKISTGASYNKFGIALDIAPAAYDHARALPGLKVQGVAVHIGSQITDLAPLEAAFRKLGGLIADLRAAGHASPMPTSAAGSACPTTATCRRRPCPKPMARWRRAS